MWRFLYRIFCGFFLGLSALAPGISGSIIAIMMGIYHDLLRIISNPMKKLKENSLFCLPLAIGIAFSVVAFVLIFSFLFETFEKATYLLFVGLIVGNLPTIISETKRHGFGKLGLLCGFIAMIAAFTLAIAVISGGYVSGEDAFTAGLPLLIGSGLLAGASLLVPGISFSIILILMGVYGQLIEAGKALLQGNTEFLLPIVVFVFSLIAGLALASRVIKTVFEKYPAVANTMVLGFIIGSLVGMLVQSLRMDDPGFIWWHGALTLAGGLGLSALFVFLGKHKGVERGELREES